MFPIAALTIPAGQTQSDILTILNLAPPVAMYCYAPATLPDTVTVYVDPDGTGTFVALQSGGSDVTLPANKCTALMVVVAAAVRLVASAPVAADRVFRVATGVPYR